MLANGDIAIAVCDRCHAKKPYKALSPDRNSPGLRVCEECNDLFDPYRLPGKPADPISMRFPRPDTPLTDGRRYVVTENGEWVYADEGDLSP